MLRASNERHEIYRTTLLSKWNDLEVTQKEIDLSNARTYLGGKDICSDFFIGVTEVLSRIVSLARTLGIKMIRSTATIQAIKRDRPAGCIGIDISRNPFIVIPNIDNGVNSLGLVGSVEVVRESDIVHAIKRHREAALGWENLPNRSLKAVSKICDSVLHLSNVGGVEVVWGGQFVGPQEGDCRTWVRAFLEIVISSGLHEQCEMG